MISGGHAQVSVAVGNRDGASFAGRGRAEPFVFAALLTFRGDVLLSGQARQTSRAPSEGEAP